MMRVDAPYVGAEIGRAFQKQRANDIDDGAEEGEEKVKGESHESREQSYANRRDSLVV